MQIELCFDNRNGQVTDLIFFMNEDSPKSPALLEVAASTQTTAEGGKPSVAVFSKEEDTCFLFQTFFQMWGYQVEGANNFEKLISLVQSHSPTIILIDSIFPFNENLDIIRRLKSDGGAARTPVLMISGFSQPRFRQLALAAGVDEYVIKPVNFDALEDSIKKYTSHIF